MEVSPDNKLIARHALAAFGGTPSVRAYHHDTERLTVDILRCDNRPCSGVTSYSTIGLSDSPMYTGAHSEYPTRLELAGACATASDQFANILASAAFCIMRTQKLYSTGSVMPEYVREYYPSTTVPHLYFTAPFLWEETLRTIVCEMKRVSWLLIVPISDAEQGYLQEHGDNALEDLFEEHQIDVFDLSRPSVA